MAISNLSSGFRPGVCTSTTRPTSPYEGFLIYETDTNRVLVWDNAAWVMIADTDQPPGLQHIKTQTIGSAVASVTVSDAFSADFDNYRIIVSGGSGSTAATLQLQLGSSTSGYYAALATFAYSNGAFTGYGDNNSAQWTYAGASHTGGLSMDVVLYQPFAAIRTGYSTIGRTDTRTTGSGSFGQGFHDSATSYSSFIISPNTGTMTGGTIRVYGFRNS